MADSDLRHACRGAAALKSRITHAPGKTKEVDPYPLRWTAPDPAGANLGLYAEPPQPYAASVEVGVKKGPAIQAFRGTPRRWAVGKANMVPS